MNSHVTLRPAEDGIVVLEMHDESGKNSFREPFVDELIAALRQTARDTRAKVMVMAGLPEVFCSGAPRDLLLRLATGELAPSDIVLAGLLLDLPIPVISAMEGHATGGGLALGLCADIIIMARESRYGCTFMNLGFTPGMGITRLLEHVLSPAIAHELLYSGELRRGSDFQPRSGINHIVPRGEVRKKALDLARRIADKPRAALVVLKRSLSIRRRQAFEETRSLEALMHEVSFAEAEVRRRIEEEYDQ